MANLKQLKDRIASVKSTRKVTQAMKVVSASKLKKARNLFDSNKEYIDQLDLLMQDVFNNIVDRDLFPLVFGRSESKINKTLIIIFGSDRGLCGAFNSGLVRYLKNELANIHGSEKEILCIGKKVYDALKNSSSLKVQLFKEDANLTPDDTKELSESLVRKFHVGELDRCVIFYNQFVSPITQKNTYRNLLPLFLNEDIKSNQEAISEKVVFENDPKIEEMAAGLAELYIDATIFSVLLETTSGEQGARMAAMDNAQRNAGEIIKKVTTLYNRTRQASVTNELIEIISGMEAIRKN